MNFRFHRSLGLIVARSVRGCQAAILTGIAVGADAKYLNEDSLHVAPAVRMPDGFDADAFRGKVLSETNVALGGGLARLQGSVFRIGHLGDLNEPMILGCLSTIEMQLKRQGIPHGSGGVDAAIESLA